MALPDYFGLGFSRGEALRVRQLVEEAAPYCNQCKSILFNIDRQFAVLSGDPVPPDPLTNCCGPTPPPTP